jgi:hypothetical protein
MQNCVLVDFCCAIILPAKAASPGISRLHPARMRKVTKETGWKISQPDGLTFKSIRLTVIEIDFNMRA